jgi:acetolactate synthase-1/3 small subunit
MTQEFTITAFSENSIGLLNRITIIFTRRSVNIESLTVSESSIKGIHKFTIVVNATEEQVINVVHQIEKLVEVLKAYYHRCEDIIFQEVALYKVQTHALLEGKVIEKIVRKYSARILEVTPEYIVLEKTGHEDETQHLFEELKKIGVKQFTRSGRIAITKSNVEYLSEYLSKREVGGKDDM